MPRTIQDIYADYCILVGSSVPPRSPAEIQTLVDALQLRYDQVTDKRFWSRVRDAWLRGDRGVMPFAEPAEELNRRFADLGMSRGILPAVTVSRDAYLWATLVDDPLDIAEFGEHHYGTFRGHVEREAEARQFFVRLPTPQLHEHENGCWPSGSGC